MTNVYVYQRAGDVIVAINNSTVAVDDPWELVAQLIEAIIQADQVTKETA
jgi:hypothetical protein